MLVPKNVWSKKVLNIFGPKIKIIKIIIKNLGQKIYGRKILGLKILGPLNVGYTNI